jgi:hypothetical protein
LLLENNVKTEDQHEGTLTRAAIITKAQQDQVNSQIEGEIQQTKVSRRW